MLLGSAVECYTIQLRPTAIYFVRLVRLDIRPFSNGRGYINGYLCITLIVRHGCFSRHNLV